jgi:hypothetical protein
MSKLMFIVSKERNVDIHFENPLHNGHYSNYLKKAH